MIVINLQMMLEWKLSFLLIQVLGMVASRGTQGGSVNPNPQQFPQTKGAPLGGWDDEVSNPRGGLPPQDTPVWKIEDAIPGVPGQSYPNLDKVPTTSFDCSRQMFPGYYADMEAQCQVFHICQADGRQNSFLCPLGTIFNQETFVCDWWFNVNCGDTAQYTSRNDNLYKSPYIGIDGQKIPSYSRGQGVGQGAGNGRRGGETPSTAVGIPNLNSQNGGGDWPTQVQGPRNEGRMKGEGRSMNQPPAFGNRGSTGNGQNHVNQKGRMAGGTNNPGRNPNSMAGGPNFPGRNPNGMAGGPNFPGRNPNGMAGGPNFPGRNPNSMAGGPNLTGRNPNAMAGGPNFPGRNPSSMAGGPNLPRRNPNSMAGGPNFPGRNPNAMAGGPNLPRRNSGTNQKGPRRRNGRNQQRMHQRGNEKGGNNPQMPANNAWNRMGVMGNDNGNRGVQQPGAMKGEMWNPRRTAMQGGNPNRGMTPNQNKGFDANMWSMRAQNVQAVPEHTIGDSGEGWRNNADAGASPQEGNFPPFPNGLHGSNENFRDSARNEGNHDNWRNGGGNSPQWNGNIDNGKGPNQHGNAGFSENYAWNSENGFNEESSWQRNDEYRTNHNDNFDYN